MLGVFGRDELGYLEHAAMGCVSHFEVPENRGEIDET
jgi:hypothetical protein